MHLVIMSCVYFDVSYSKYNSTSCCTTFLSLNRRYNQFLTYASSLSLFEASPVTFLYRVLKRREYFDKILCPARRRLGEENNE